MAYEKSKFGDGSPEGSGNVVKQVSNHFGPFTGGNTQGAIKTEGGIKEITIDFNGATAAAQEFPLETPFLPALGLVTNVYLEVEEAFDLGGTTPAVEVGTEGSEDTDGVTLSEAQLEAVGVYDVTDAVSGTWSAGLTDKTDIGIALSGTTPTSANAGKARLVIRYVKV